MNKTSRLTAVILALLLLFSMTGCNKEVKETTSSAVNVSVSTVKKQTIENTVTYTGEIKALEYTSVSAKVSGAAKGIFFEVGDYVNEGDILLQIDNTDYLTQYNQAQAAYLSAVSQSKSAAAAAQLEYNNAKINHDNQKVLYDNGAISKLAYDTAVTRFENAKINLESATGQAGLDAAKATLDAAQNALDYTTLRAPISGYISSKNANPGQMVSPGVEVFSIKKTDSVNAQINVTESIIPSINIGTRAIVKVKSADEEIEGEVTSVSPTKSAQTGMYQVSIAIENVDGKLNDGMFADVTLTLSDSVDALVVPSEAILEDEDGGMYVYVTNGDTAERVNVKVGIITDEFTEIVSGVKKGDKVIVSGKEYLSDKNNEIRVVK